MCLSYQAVVLRKRPHREKGCVTAILHNSLNYVGNKTPEVPCKVTFDTNYGMFGFNTKRSNDY